MKIVICSCHDWANVGYILCQCLKSLGVDAESYALRIVDRYDTSKSSKIVSNNEMHDIIMKADIIQFMHSHLTVNSQMLIGKNVFIFHGGSFYRKNYKEINRVCKPIVKANLIQTIDLWDLGAMNKEWLLPGVDLEEIKPSYTRVGNILTIGHFPSNPNKKGTDEINATIKSLKADNGYCEKFNYITSNAQVLQKENLERMKKCDIYIEQMKLGEWGMTTLEAAALGKIVVTNFKALPKYLNEYGPCELIVANNKTELRKSLIKLINSSDDEIKNKKKATRKWVSDFHNYDVTGKKLLDIYSKYTGININEFIIRRF